MSAILPLIEDAIDVPLMDVKNIAKIIDAYSKYDVRDWSSFEFVVNLSCYGFRGEEFKDECWYFTQSINGEEETYEYLTRLWTNFSFDEQGKVIVNNRDESAERAVLNHFEKNYGKLVFIKDEEGDYYNVYNKKQVSKEALIKLYQKHLKAVNIKLKAIDKFFSTASATFAMYCNNIRVFITTANPDRDDPEYEDFVEFYDEFENLLLDEL